MLERTKYFTDLLSESNKYVNLAFATIHLTIPSHFLEWDKAAYLEAATAARFGSIQSVDEQLALANACEALYKISEGENYLLIHSSGSKIIISLFKSQKYPKNEIHRVLIDCTNFYESKMAWFDGIIGISRPQM